LQRYIVFILFSALLTATATCRAQLWPAEQRSLNYRLVPFGCADKGKGTYKFEVAIGTAATEEEFKRSVCRTSEVTTSRTIIELPAWGTAYTWRVTYIKPKANPVAGPFIHFSTKMHSVVDTASCRLRVLQNTGKFDGFIFMDRNYTLYNAAGEPLWFLPPIDTLSGQLSNIRDLKMTDAGTITFLLNDWPYETDYNGRVLWKGVHEGVVSGDTDEHYHHEVTRMRNGHYMVLGNEMLRWRKERLPADITDPKEIKSYEERIRFGTIIEYDRWGNTKWQWKSSPYYYDSPMYYKQKIGRLTDIHQNAFFFDEQRNAIYISFKNISQLMKINYPEGKVQFVLGSKGGTPRGHDGTSMFCHQHSCRLTRDGYIYLYNNNICNRGAAPTIMMIREPAHKQDTAEKIWEYTCPILPGQEFPDRKPFFTNGGSILERPDGSFFVSMCAPYANVFIVNRNKQLLYSALPEGRLPDSTTWEPITQYRASIVNTQAELNKLVMSAIPEPIQ
jgi:hypothetical protein